MRARDHASRHFDEMSRFATSLADLRAQVLDYSWSYTLADDVTKGADRSRTPSSGAPELVICRDG
jgi:hypothetical protein